jgi:hypothetical protein
VLQAAFRDLHAARLHGFCLLVSLGDRHAASSAAAGAMAEAIHRLAELRHPERAAAWLRRRAARAALAQRRPREPEPLRRETLRALGVSDAAFDGLAGLDHAGRVAFVTAAIERLEPIDVEAVVGHGPAETRRLVERARLRYLAAATAALARESGLHAGGADAPPGELTSRIESLAEQALGGPWRSG